MTTTITPPEAHWRDTLAKGRFMLQHNPHTGQAYFPPRLCDPDGARLEWMEASGAGVVYAVTVISARPPESPRNVVLVDLAEGPRMMARVDGIAPEDIRIGMAVQARIIEDTDGPLIVFHPA